MASTIKIKRSGSTAAPTGGLAAGELAYSWNSNKLYIGTGTENAGIAANIDVIGGKEFTDKLDHTNGVLTASSALVVDANKKLDELLVDSLSLNDNILSSTSTLKLQAGTTNLIEIADNNVIVGGPFGGSQLNISGSSAYLKQLRSGSVNLVVGANEVATSTMTFNNDGTLTIPGTIKTLSNGDLTLAPNGTGKLVLNNPYINGTSDTLAEYIYDTVGGAITAGTGITIANSDAGNTSTVSITNTGVTAGSYGSATAIPVLTINAQGQVTLASTESISTALSIAGDTGTDTVALGVDTLTFTGGTGITSSVSDNVVTLDIDDTVATLTGTQTLTNKSIDLANNTLTATSAQLATAISDETGSGSLVFATAPTFTTSIDGGATFGAFGSSTALTLGYTGTATNTTNIATGATANATTKTVNIGTGGAAGSTTNVNLGSASGGIVTVNNNLTVTGDLTVNGTTTTVNSTTLTVDDKNIELGSVAIPSNATADGGGITLKGTTDKTFNWINATAAWTSSEDLNLLTGKVYEINGTTVLSASTLGSGVTSSSLTSVGTITTGVWQGTVVGPTYGGTGLSTYATGDLLYASAPNTLAKRAIGTEGKVLQVSADGVPVWGDLDGGTY